MHGVEDILYSVTSSLGPFRRPVQKIIASPAVWSLSGLSYPSAVIATTGSLGSVKQYLAGMRARMLPLSEQFPPDALVLEFGTGIGGNLLSISDRFTRGIGLDVNHGYVRVAERIREAQGVRNVEFAIYDGESFPRLPLVDTVFSIGAFERIARPKVIAYVNWLRQQVKPTGSLLLYFLTVRARDRGFGRLLGFDRYVYWSEEELGDVFSRCRLRPLSRVQNYLGAGDLYHLVGRVSDL